MPGVTARRPRGARVDANKQQEQEKAHQVEVQAQEEGQQQQGAVSADGGRSGEQFVSRRLLVLLHGEKANDDLVRDAISRVRKDGHKVAVRVTYEAGDIDRLVAEALKLGTADTLVAAGGDGTVNEVVAAILRHTGGLQDTRHAGVSDVSSNSSTDLQEYAQHQVAAPDARLSPRQKASTLVELGGSREHVKQVTMGILPMGTSNDFAATTGIPQDPYEALSLATRPDCAKPIDVGLVNNRIFMNTATVGASADVGKRTSSAIKKVLGPAAFLLTGARTMISWHPHTSTLRFPNVSPPSLPPGSAAGGDTASSSRQDADATAAAAAPAPPKPLAQVTSANAQSAAVAEALPSPAVVLSAEHNTAAAPADGAQQDGPAAATQAAAAGGGPHSDGGANGASANGDHLVASVAPEGNPPENGAPMLDQVHDKDHHHHLHDDGLASATANSVVSEIGIDTARARRLAEGISDGLKTSSGRFTPRSESGRFTPRSNSGRFTPRGGSGTDTPPPAYLRLDSKNQTLQRSSSMRNSSGKAVRIGGGWASAPFLPPPPVSTPRSSSMRTSSFRSPRQGSSLREAAAEAAVAAAPAGPEEEGHEEQEARASGPAPVDGPQHTTSAGQSASPPVLQNGQGVGEAAQEARTAEQAQSGAPLDAADGRPSPQAGGAAAGAVAEEGQEASPPEVTAPSPAAGEAAASTQATITELQGVPLLHMTAANNRQIASMVVVSPNALLDDGLLDVIYLTGTPGQQVRRVLKDFLKHGWANTRSVPCLLRVPWLEIATDEALEWSLDGEPAAHPSMNLRLSLLHRAILTHLPDDRMLMAGNKGADAAAVAVPAGYKGQSRKRRVLRSLLRPGPTLAELLGSVVVFRKKRNWRKVLLGTLRRTAQASVLMALGGAAVHTWHSRQQQPVAQSSTVSGQLSVYDEKGRFKYII